MCRSVSSIGMIAKLLFVTVSIPLASTRPYNRTVNLERLPPAYTDAIPTFSINHCSANQTAALSVAIQNAWTDAVRAYIDVGRALPSPAFTTFFKASDSIGNVSLLFNDIIEKRGAPQVPEFHCVSETYEQQRGEYRICMKTYGTLGFTSNSASFAICPGLFDLPVGDVIGDRKSCPKIQNNIFVGTQNYTGGFPRTWSREILSIMLTKYVLNAAGLLVSNHQDQLLTLDAGPLSELAVSDNSALNAAVGRGVEESKINSLNYIFYALFVNNDCDRLPDIRLPPWSFGMVGNNLTNLAGTVETYSVENGVSRPA